MPLLVGGDARADTPPSPWQLGAPRRLELGASLGSSSRIDDSAAAADRASGLLVGAGADVFLADRVTFGLGYEHRDLGQERGPVLERGSVRVTRGAHSGWLSLGLYPLQTEHVGLVLRLAAGGSWQHARASGSVWAAEDPGRAAPFACRGSGSMAFGLRTGLGIVGFLSDSVRAELSGTFDNLALGDGLLDGCAAGAGSVQALGLRLGVAYMFSAFQRREPSTQSTSARPADG